MNKVKEIRLRLWHFWFKNWGLNRVFRQVEKDYEDYASRVIDPMDFYTWCEETTKDRPSLGER